MRLGSLGFRRFSNHSRRDFRARARAGFGSIESLMSPENAMSISEYILALMSIIVGLAMTQLLSGAAEIVQHAKPMRSYRIHTVVDGESVCHSDSLLMVGIWP